MINSSGFHDDNPSKKDVKRPGKVTSYTALRDPPPPPVSVGGDNEAPNPHGMSMSMFQRMLTPSVSDTDSPSKKQQQPSDDFRVSCYTGNSKTKPNKELWITRRWIKHPPVETQRPNPDKEVRNPFLSRREGTKQERFRNNALPCVVEDGSDGHGSDDDLCEASSPASCDSGRSDGDTEAQHDAHGMSTFQRMLTPPVSDTNSPPKKQASEPIRVLMAGGRSRTERNKVRDGQKNSINHPPFQPDRPDPTKQKVGCSRKTHGATKQKHSDKPERTARLSDNTLTASTPAPSGVDSDHGIQEDDSVQDSDDTKDGEDLARFRQMLTPPVEENESPPKKQDSTEDLQVFIHSGNYYKTTPNKKRCYRTVIRLPPFRPNPPHPDKQKQGGFLERQRKRRKKQAKKEKPCCDQSQSARPYPVVSSSDNDADKEDNGNNKTPPASSSSKTHSSSAVLSTTTTQQQIQPLPPTTPDRPIITRSRRSKQLAEGAAEEQQTTNDKYLQAPPSISFSPPSVRKRKGDDEDLRSSQPNTTPVSPLSQRRPVKRPRGGSPGNSPLASPNARPTKRRRYQ
jgi:hypothetical protein